MEKLAAFQKKLGYQFNDEQCKKLTV